MSLEEMAFHDALSRADEDDDARQLLDEHIARESELIRKGRFVVKQRYVEYVGEA